MKTRIFISSTCYDLSELRAKLEAEITTIGHEVLRSESNNFPVKPKSNAVDNCFENIREHADILVLVVGGEVGSTDQGSGKSITNLEYEEAIAAGLPVFVFARRDVLNLRNLWKLNPTQDYSPTVRDNRLFDFLEIIHDENKSWVFGFDNGEEIADTLKTQLSYLLRTLAKTAKPAQTATALPPAEWATKYINGLRWKYRTFIDKETEVKPICTENHSGESCRTDLIPKKCGCGNKECTKIKFYCPRCRKEIKQIQNTPKEEFYATTRALIDRETQ